ncbi:MAG: nucleoside 2-deoxyribosyltransferase domain-containing protein [Bacteroidetes bacterium]|nr:nucleoside 2-deoxyribosyltransferase domain-containing protein [Bacteroidota bacterium]MCB0845646.1 nucleoside 2-deoxyribosyltransferase domain-containing protein [Bacteroidota bacterium]MCB0852036.1 nucleoside 2-deoxyribosyltransferase domain-containing protein [Bacteroidota bacterium]
MKKIIKPPESISKHHLPGNSLIFLAGSIEMGLAENWQQKVENYFRDLDTFTLLNPRRDDWDDSWEQKFENAQFYQQVNWELTGLERADKIIMYLSPETKAPISMLELGLHANSNKLLICCPEGFWRKGNVEVVCERYCIPLYENLDQLLSENFPK